MVAKTFLKLFTTVSVNDSKCKFYRSYDAGNPESMIQHLFPARRERVTVKEMLVTKHYKPKSFENAKAKKMRSQIFQQRLFLG